MGIWSLVTPSADKNGMDAKVHADIEESSNDNQKDKLTKRGFLMSETYSKAKFCTDFKYAIAYVFCVGAFSYRVIRKKAKILHE